MVGLKDLQNQEIVHCTQDNMMGLMRFWSHLTVAFDSIEDDRCFRVHSKLAHPLFNNIIKTDFHSDVPNSVTTIIQDYKNLHVPFLWRIWNHDQPQNIDEILLDNDGQQIPSTTLMAIDLASFKPLSKPMDDLKIRVVRNNEQAAEFTKCSSAVFEIPYLLSGAITDIMAKQNANLANFVGYINGTAVTTSTLFYEKGIAGIYNVATLPEFQGKGIGQEIMTALLLKAKLDGYKTAILHATSAGLRLYEKLGFQKYGEMRQFLFS